MQNSEQQFDENNVGEVSKDGPEQRICVVKHMWH